MSSLSQKQSKHVSQTQKRDSINVQQYQAQKFTEPEDLEESDSQESIVEQFVDNDGKVKQRKAGVSGSKNNNSNGLTNNPHPNTSTPLSSTPKPSSKQATHPKRSSLQQPSQQDQQQSQKQRVRNELILQFKISQLQKICSTLTSANEKLLDKIEELQDENDRFKSRISVLEKDNDSEDQYKERDSREENEFVESLDDSREDLSNRKDSESLLMQNAEEEQNALEQEQQEQLKLEEEVVDIEKMIQEYRQELNKAEEINKNNKELYENHIRQLQEELKEVRSKFTEVEAINKEMEEQLVGLEEKNQLLEQEIEAVMRENEAITQQQEYHNQDNDSRNRTESRSSQYQTPTNQRHFTFNQLAQMNQMNPNPTSLNQPRNPRLSPTTYYQDYDYPQHHLSPFDSSVQTQLQKLIQKLVKQLQHQRQIKKRMTQEMKRIQRDLLESEKEIMLKNKKIYELEMNLIKGEKSGLFVGGVNASQVYDNGSNRNSEMARNAYVMRGDVGQGDRNLGGSGIHSNRSMYNSPKIKDLSPKIKEKYLQQQQPQANHMSPYQPLKPRVNTSTSTITYTQSPLTSSPQPQPKQFLPSRNPNLSQSPSSSSQQGKLLQTFSLLQLLNQPTITLTIRQKLHIALKLVSFYEQKIYQYKNYNLLMLENVLVTNFNKMNLRLVKIRVEEHKKIAENEVGNNNTGYRSKKPSKDDVADGPEKVIWNLGFLLNSLLMDVPTKEDDLGANDAQKDVLQSIDSILDNKNLNRETVVELKRRIEVALEQRVQ